MAILSSRQLRPKRFVGWLKSMRSCLYVGEPCELPLLLLRPLCAFIPRRKDCSLTVSDLWASGERSQSAAQCLIL